jgi:phosphoenolpyruvate carboxykinase (GTP)
MRVLEWIVGRCEGTAKAVDTPLGLVPDYDAIHWQGLDFDRERFDAVTRIERDEWQRELESHDSLFRRVGARLPPQLSRERRQLGVRLGLGQ